MTVMLTRPGQMNFSSTGGDWIEAGVVASGARFFRLGDVTLWWAEDGECGSVGSHAILENGDRANIARVHRTLRAQ